MITITMLGTGAQMPMPNRHLSSVLMSYKGCMILFDCGEGTQVAMRRANTGFKALDIICISHVHGDHIFGLPGLLTTMANCGREKAVLIISPEGTESIIKALLDLTGNLPFEIHIRYMLTDKLRVKEIDNSLVAVEYDEIADIEISTMELFHSITSIGYRYDFLRRPHFDVELAVTNNVPRQIWSRLQKGETVEYEDIEYRPYMVLGGERKSLSISIIGDTRSNDVICDFVRESQLLISEATYGNDEDMHKAVKNYHMTFREAATMADKARVNNLILSHFSTSITNPSEYSENALSVFDNTIVAEDLMQFTISYKGGLVCRI